MLRGRCLAAVRPFHFRPKAREERGGPDPRARFLLCYSRRVTRNNYTLWSGPRLARARARARAISEGQKTILRSGASGDRQERSGGSLLF